MKTDTLPKTVFLTGATGHMGGAALKELLSRNGRFKVTVLARPSQANRKKLSIYKDNPLVRIVWGDLCCYEDVLQGVNGADYVLHVGGMVSPAADAHPLRTMQVNIGSSRNIIRAVKAQKVPDSIGVVYVGSVAQCGQHTPPHHWGRAGDPLFTSEMDWYSVSKCLAEWEFAESGLKRWVSVRQTGMLYPELLKKANNPIVFHTPFLNVLEWSTIEDSGRVLAQCCEDNVPEEFWRGFYNLSSGPSFRLTNYEFETKLLSTIGCPPPEKVFDTGWFATRNFHGEWYSDSDRLEQMLHFREGITCDEYFRRMKKNLPWYFSLSPLVPAFIIKAFMKHIALTDPLGTLYWLQHSDEERIRAHFGSREAQAAIPSWKEGFIPDERPSDTPGSPLDHGYDENKPFDSLTREDLQHAAEFRGGTVLFPEDEITPYRPLRWRCQFGHEFTATPNTVLKGGHWCPRCYPQPGKEKNPWHFDDIAAGNKFFAQVYLPSKSL